MDLHEQISLIELCLEHDVFDVSKIIKWADEQIMLSPGAEEWMIELSLYKGNNKHEVIEILHKKFGYPSFRSFTTLIAALCFFFKYKGIEAETFFSILAIEKDSSFYKVKESEDIAAIKEVCKIGDLLESQNYDEPSLETATERLNTLFNISSNKHLKVEEFLKSVT